MPPRRQPLPRPGSASPAASSHSEVAAAVEEIGGGDDEFDDDGEEEEGYVFDPSDFPMLEGEFDFFGADDGGLEGEEAAGGDRGATVEPQEGNAAAGGRKPKPVQLPVVAVIGRPNVGKSTIVNRLCRSMSTVRCCVGIGRSG